MKSTALTIRALSFTNLHSYLFVILFIAGNLIFPAICHLVPKGGLIFLPMFFFTLIAAYKFGLKAGLATAILSPLANYLIFGMPIIELLPLILAKSIFLATLAWILVRTTQKLSLILIGITVLAYQIFGFLAEILFFTDFAVAINNLALSIPGMLLQILFGFLILKKIAKK